MEEKCCWSECENKPEVSVGNNLNKGNLDMCEDCLNKWNQHQDARQEMFFKEGFYDCKRKAEKIIKEELGIKKEK